MVSEQDIEQTLEDTTSDGNQTEETAANFGAAVVNARISATMDEPLTCHHVSLPKLYASVLPPQTELTIPSVQPSSSSAAYIAPNAPNYVLPPNSDRPPQLLPSNLYTLPPTDLSYHPNVKNPQIHSTFEIATIEATLGTTSNTPLLMYSENPITLFLTLSSSYVSENASLTTLGAIVRSDIRRSLSLLSIDCKNPWILDSGVTDHLTSSSEHFVSYISCARNEKIRIVDGSLVPIVGEGHISLFNGFSLHNVLHVPRISYNLLAISKITRELNCKATFLLDSVSFQDLRWGRMIDTTRHNRGLYLLDDNASSRSISKTSL
ncbi:reverse transcriptase [Cucumis melo var. makuwa]|uniref:Reverse transcriptase n=1 Tax=Cucumis melo var. makuwa TaxID=1194695 RepID=A0A5A7TYR5_CUCMM|nr:reverse transcriptase [Cucumis melo var. makuwa]TYK07970.1 reverse transcriptase [Cucumis melo var. makuwa]